MAWTLEGGGGTVWGRVWGEGGGLGAAPCTRWATARPNCTGVGQGRGPNTPPVQVQGAAVLGLVDVLEELRGLVLEHGISQDLGVRRPQCLAWSQGFGGVGLGILPWVVSTGPSAALTMARLKTPPTGPSCVASAMRARAPSSELALLVDTSSWTPWSLNPWTCLAW